jgi:hypothetical protein
VDARIRRLGGEFVGFQGNNRNYIGYKNNADKTKALANGKYSGNIVR